EVGHFGLAVRDPKESAKWFERALGLREEFDFENGVAVGNDYVTIALFIGKHGPLVPRSRRLPLGVKRARRKISLQLASHRRSSRNSVVRCALKSASVDALFEGL